MIDTPLFDLAESIRHRDKGMELAAEHNAPLLIQAREIAISIARERGTVTADDVTRRLMQQGHRADCLGNAAGSIFKDRRFEFTGERIKSRRIKNHARELKVWRLSLTSEQAGVGQSARDLS